MGTVRVPLGSRKYPGLFALIDEEDAERVLAHRWNPAKGKTGDFFVKLYVPDIEGIETRLSLHRFILSLPESQTAEHINRDRLDNRRSNLRLVASTNALRSKALLWCRACKQDLPRDAFDPCEPGGGLHLRCRACRATFHLPNQVEDVDERTVRILLDRGWSTMIDRQDLNHVRPYRWRVSLRPRERYYVVALVGDKQVMLHNFLMGVEEVGRIDHVDCDGLNNRRQNLRPCTLSQNGANAKLSARNTSGYKGVYLSQWGTWRACIRQHGRSSDLGGFSTPEDAAVAYDAAARQRFGEFARLNFPRPGERGVKKDADHG